MNFAEHREISRQTWHKENVSHQRRLEHAKLGLIDELGEIASCLKKNIGYGKEIDIINMKEELGDFIYFLQRYIDELPIHVKLDNIIRDTNPVINKPINSIIWLSVETNKVIKTDNFEGSLIIIVECLIELINNYGFTISEVLEANISKLKARYGDKLEFTQEKAINRDLDKEKIALNKQL